MDRAFLDANVLFAAGYRETTPIMRLWDLPDLTLLSSVYAIEEARRNLTTAVQRVRLIERTRCMEIVFEEAEHMASAGQFGLPPKDVPILAAAIAGKATHLLTGDVRHFRPLMGARIQGLCVMKTADYLRLKETAE